ncbi:UDP-N-acetylmuramoyl-L-alanyl-D-glutamate--2,6-diaminopimelate ligase [Candidatus Fermentibacteria bacterium]|nr:UDP-N-acetylmuramoyl-L-alanyl-D-glutamate--2,6-diaminopimelate ligase [Candidatus Fermentibacteria bacterium]
MKLATLLQSAGIPCPASMESLEITSLACDSRKVRPGSLFVAIRGFREDGRSFVGSALDSGASAALVESRSPSDAPSVIVNPSGDNRRAMCLLAAEFFGRPWERLEMIGVTGTNGKTSTAHMVRWIMEGAGRRCGILGTVGHVVAGIPVPASETTPDSLRLTELLGSMSSGGDAACVMEVSSHALELSRVEAVRFDAALFTNVTQDHLDFHGTMERYIAAKMHLADLLKPGGRAVFGTYAPGWNVPLGALTFGTSEGDSFRVRDVRSRVAGVSYVLDGPGFSIPVDLAVPARVNAFNSAGAIAACTLLGIPADRSAELLSSFPGVPGRMERVDAGQDFLLAVDYAHTPDALERVLTQARELSEGRVIVVFGAGGDRDRSKRPLMGAVAGSLADVVIVTSDNPRTEDPAAIIAGIVAGIPAGCAPLVEPDRRSAIRAAVRLAMPGDVVIVAGKGHEDYQVIGKERLPFDDRIEARNALGELR